MLFRSGVDLSLGVGLEMVELSVVRWNFGLIVWLLLQRCASVAKQSPEIDFQGSGAASNTIK